MRPFSALVLALFLSLLGSCARGAQAPASAPAEAGPAGPDGLAKGVGGREISVFVVMDTSDVWSEGVRAGFSKTLDGLLAPVRASARYIVEDTKLDPEAASSIVSKIEAAKPDLICTVVFPDGFANVHVAQKLKGESFRFVSMDAVPVQTGTIVSAERPGGNITGVGVFLPMNPALKLARRLVPAAKRLYFFSWDAMAAVNEWFRSELARACAEEGFELAAFELVPDLQAEFDFLRAFETPRPEAVVMGGISAFVDRDGSPADTNSLEPQYVRTRLRTLSLAYDGAMVERGFPAGVSVIWEDIGAQLAEKAGRVLAGEDPGSIPWDYPRKYNVLLNLPSLERIGAKAGEDLLVGAYRVYTDYEGHFAGQAE